MSCWLKANLEAALEHTCAYTGGMAYSDTDKALVIAAVERYGETTGLRMLADNLELCPGRATVQRWVRGGEAETTAEAKDFWSTLEQGRKARLQAAIEPRIYTTLEAHDRALADDKALAAQQLATAAGILTDKLVPPPKSGVGTPAGGRSHSGGEHHGRGLAERAGN